MNEQEVACQLTAHDHEISSLKHRVCDLEASEKTMSQLVRSVDKLAMNMERMLAEQTATRYLLYQRNIDLRRACGLFFKGLAWQDGQ